MLPRLATPFGSFPPMGFLRESRLPASGTLGNEPLLTHRSTEVYRSVPARDSMGFNPCTYDFCRGVYFVVASVSSSTSSLGIKGECYMGFGGGGGGDDGGGGGGGLLVGWKWK